MGLVISYRLSLISPTIDAIHQKVIELRNIAINLGFIQVGEITTLEGDECTIDMEDGCNDPNIELKTHASEMIGYENRKFLFRHPSVIIGFRCQPGGGCAMADFGFRILQTKRISKNGPGSTIAKHNMPAIPNMVDSKISLIAISKSFIYWMQPRKWESFVMLVIAVNIGSLVI